MEGCYVEQAWVIWRSNLWRVVISLRMARTRIAVKRRCCNDVRTMDAPQYKTIFNCLANYSWSDRHQYTCRYTCPPSVAPFPGACTMVQVSLMCHRWSGGHWLDHWHRKPANHHTQWRCYRCQPDPQSKSVVRCLSGSLLAPHASQLQPD